MIRLLLLLILMVFPRKLSALLLGLVLVSSCQSAQTPQEATQTKPEVASEAEKPELKVSPKFKQPHYHYGRSLLTLIQPNQRLWLEILHS